MQGPRMLLYKLHRPWKKKKSSLQFAKPCAQDRGWGVGVWICPEEGEPSSNFSQRWFFLWRYSIGPADIMGHQHWAKSVCSLGSISTFGCRTKSHTRPEDCRSLSLMLAQRDLRESVVLAYHGKENRTRAEDPWVNPRPATPSLYDSGEVTS